MIIDQVMVYICKYGKGRLYRLHIFQGCISEIIRNRTYEVLNEIIAGRIRNKWFEMLS